MHKIKKALVSVSNKSGVVELCQKLHELNIEIISTGGTAKVLLENNIPITPIEKITNNPESFDGRMKTISFQIGSSLLFDRNNPKHTQEAKDLNIDAIDLVVCNLYPFEETAKTTDNLDLLIEKIDIGGPTMLRAAAKNFNAVTVLCSPKHYEDFSKELANNNGATTLAFRKKMAFETFNHTANYDEAIKVKLKSTMELEEHKLRYGENPHQKSLLTATNSENSLLTGKQLQGKTFSYNNFLDMDAAWNLVSELDKLDNKTYFTVFKHVSPCGVSGSTDPVKALEYAWDGDSTSAFGSIVTTNHELDSKCAQFLCERFVEIIMAPSFSDEAKSILSKKKNLRLYELDVFDHPEFWEARSISGATLYQERDFGYSGSLKTVTNNDFPNNSELLSKFGIIIGKYLKSNAINIVSKDGSGDFWLSGSGAGQPNRLESFQLCAKKFYKLQENFPKERFQNNILTSDAFFPFDDIVRLCTEVGITNIIQPGGSIKDEVVINTANELGLAMKFTGYRHFKH